MNGKECTSLHLHGTELRACTHRSCIGIAIFPLFLTGIPEEWSFYPFEEPSRDECGLKLCSARTGDSDHSHLPCDTKARALQHLSSLSSISLACLSKFPPMVPAAFESGEESTFLGLSGGSSCLLPHSCCIMLCVNTVMSRCLQFAASNFCSYPLLSCKIHISRC